MRDAFYQSLVYATIAGGHSLINGTAPAGYTLKVTRESVTVAFKQAIGADEPLRTGSYSKTLTFTLSTTNPETRTARHRRAAP